MVNLFINHYIDENEQRRKEIDECMKRNMGNSQIDNILVIKNRRPTFRDYFDMINILCNDTDISIISNSDIYFEDLNLVKLKLKQNECYALSRWDIMSNGSAVHFNRKDSFDSYMFVGKIKNIVDCDFTLGLAGSDNSIAERINRAGYIIKNPSIDIKTYHLHNSGVRNYKPSEQTPKPYLLITPHTLSECNVITHYIA